ncbi:MAG: hypothetical protein HY033_10385 [Ignavibacteriae bacterium]|nr:hypothetical protein [Ignavibacteria bacterium]MBI3365304.1 hypothetical protein [Ignavibacteriota bacterium]
MDVPSQRLEERIDQLIARLCLVEGRSFELMDVLLEETDELLDLRFRCCTISVHARVT